jgi:hypothetical protein
MSAVQTANGVAATAPEATGSAPAPAATASITTALSAGWLLAELKTELDHGESPRSPAASLLAEVPSRGVRARQIQAELSRLQADLDQAGITQKDSADLSTRLRELVRATDGAGHVEPENGDVPGRRLASLVADVTRAALGNLTAASPRLGRAFGLGFDLANTCKLSRSAQRDGFIALFGSRAVDVQQALADLSSSLPKHAARGVSLSLAQWQHWAMNPMLSKRPVEVWPQEGVRDALGRQGQVWRAILSGEKLGKDMLGTADYFGAVKTLARRVVKGRPWLVLLVFAFVLLAAAGVYLLIAQKQTLAKLDAVALSVLGAVGISTASLKRGFADVANEVKAQVWGAEMDYAIAEAITVPPGDWRVKLRKIQVPPPRGLDPHIAANARVVHRVAKAISERKPRLLRIWHVQRNLHDSCEYRALSDPTVAARRLEGAAHRVRVPRRVMVARRLVRERSLGRDPEMVAAGAPGRLVSQHRDQGAGTVRALVWTFRHGRVLHLEEFDNYAAAQEASNLPGPVG